MYFQNLKFYCPENIKLWLSNQMFCCWRLRVEERLELPDWLRIHKQARKQ